MCRNIKTLYNFEPQATDEEVNAAVLQFVRKVTGFQKPSQVNEKAFGNAVHEIAHVTHTLLAELETQAQPRSRELQIERARLRSQQRFGKSSI